VSLNLWLTAFLIVLTTAAAIAAICVIRSRAPTGGFLHDSERAGAIFSFVGTVFSVLLAFVIFLALETYTGAKTEAAQEADALLEQFQIAGLFSAGDGDVLRSELACYGRSVIEDEWGLMRKGKRSSMVDAWVSSIERAVDAVQIEDSKQETAFAKFFDETINREDGRRGRLAEADGVVPAPMWLILFLGSGCLVGLVLLFADRAENGLVQSAQAGAVTAIVVTSLLLVNFLDHPFRNGVASIKPTSMTLAVQMMEHELPNARSLPCDARGAPR
jgi:hypothetical protein